MTLSGLHAPNVAHFTDRDFAVVNAGKFASVKLLHYHTASDAIRLLGMGVQALHVRLPDSVTDQGRIKGDVEWAGECLDTIHKFLPYCTTYSSDNEPNLTWPREVNGVQSEWAWQFLVGRVLDILRPAVPANVRLGLGPISYGDFEQGKRWQQAAVTVSAKVDFVSCNAYWQSLTDKYLTWKQFGGLPETIRAIVPFKPIVVTEYGNSLCQKPVPPPQSLIEDAMCDQYPKYIAYLSSLGYVEAAHAFLSVGGTAEWRGFYVTERVAHALAPVAAEPSTHGRGSHGGRLDL